MCFARKLRSTELALQSDKIKKKKNPHNLSDEWLAADVSDFVIANPQTQEHPRINLDKNTQSEGSFHMVGSLVAGL